MERKYEHMERVFRSYSGVIFWGRIKIVTQIEEESTEGKFLSIFNIIKNLNNIIGRFAMGYCDSVTMCKRAW